MLSRIFYSAAGIRILTTDCELDVLWKCLAGQQRADFHVSFGESKWWESGQKQKGWILLYYLDEAFRIRAWLEEKRAETAKAVMGAEIRQQQNMWLTPYSGIDIAGECSLMTAWDPKSFLYMFCTHMMYVSSHFCLLTLFPLSFYNTVFFHDRV